MKQSFVKRLASVALALCLGLVLATGALAETATPEQSTGVVDALVAQGAELALMDEAALQDLLTQIDAAQATADDADQTRLYNLSVAVEECLQVRAAAKNGTLSELPQPAAENSWRYQNGVLQEFEEDDGGSVLFETYDADGNAHWGIDVSYHQGTVDWAAVKAAGVEFAMIRCGYGDDETDQDDAQWYNNVRGCEEQGIPYGVYLFSYATDTDNARSEAAHILRLIRGYNPSLPLFIDLEANRTLDQGNWMIGQIAQTFCDIVEGAGYRTGVYASENWWNNYLTEDCFRNNDNWYHWIACWGNLTYTGRYEMWQYTNEGSLNGVNGPVDMNFWYGDYPGGMITHPVVDEGAATIFVTRLYQVCLDRTPDPAGLQNWVNAICQGGMTGTAAASGFVFSEEFKAKNYCNTDYVKQLYRAFLGREYDGAGLADWVQRLTGGQTREAVFNGFALSGEFGAICAAGNIPQGSGMAVPTYGTVPTGPCSVCGEIDGVTAFVTRMYDVCLDRKPEAAGLADWTNRLWSHTASGRQVALGFIFSDEFKAKKYSNMDYVEYLYKAFLGRASDTAGKADWLARMANGWTREQVFDGFVGSDEFSGICSSYGIVRG